MARQFLDHYIFKVISKKLFVWAIATVLLCFGQITPDHWETLTMVYIGSQAAIDLAISWKKGILSTLGKFATTSTTTVVENGRENKEE